MNKIILVAALAYFDIQLAVLPSAWILHSPHADTSVRKVGEAALSPLFFNADVASGQAS